MKEKVKIFFLDGSIDYNELNYLDKFLFRRLLNKKQKENKLSYEHINLEKNIDMDRSNKKSIEPISDSKCSGTSSIITVDMLSSSNSNTSGQIDSHAPHPIQISLSTFAFIFDLPITKNIIPSYKLNVFFII